MSENTDPAGKVRVSERAVADYRELPEDQQADAALALDRVGVTPGRPIQADVLGFTAGGDYFVMQAKRTGPGVVYRPGNPEHDGPDTGYVITAILSAGDVRKIRNAEALTTDARVRGSISRAAVEHQESVLSVVQRIEEMVKRIEDKLDDWLDD